MSSKINRLYAFTEGERSFMIAAFGTGLFGSAISFMVINQLGGANQIIRPLSTYDVWAIFAGGIGAGAALVIARRWFGHRGVSGLVQALIGVGFVSFLASLIGGTLALPLYGTMFGPFSFVMTLMGAPFVALLWVTTILMAHVLMFAWRRERESIFESRVPAE